MNEHSACKSAMAIGSVLALALTTALVLGACSVGAPQPAELPRSESGTLLVLNKTDDSLSLIDAMTGDRLLELPTGVGPHEVAVAPDGALAVVSNYGTAQEAGHSLTVIDLARSKVAGSIDLGQHGRPHGLQFLPDGRTLVVTAESSGNVLMVDVPSLRVLRAVPTEQAVSHMLALDPQGRRAYVANIGSGSVSVVDLERGRLLAKIPTAPGAEGIDLSPDGSQLWVANRTADSVTVIDPERMVEIATLPCVSSPIRVKFTPDGRRVLISNTGTGDVAVFDAATRTEIGRIRLGLSELESTDGRLGEAQLAGALIPVGLLISRDGARAWVANTNADLVTVLDLESLEVAGRIKTGRQPDGLGWTPVMPLGM